MVRVRTPLRTAHRARSHFAAGLALLAAACGGEPELPSSTEAPKPAVAASSKISDVLTQALRSGEPQDVLVVYDGSTIEARARSLRGLSPASDARAEREPRRAFRELAFRDAKTAAQSRIDPRHATVVHDYEQLPISLVRVDSLVAALALAADPDVLQLHEDVQHEALVDENLTIINQPAALQAGFDATGAAVVLVDTGLDYTKAEFGSCAAPGAPGCRVAYVGEAAPEDFVLDDPALPHGTATAATVASVAPGAALIGLDVFNGKYAYDSDILKALNWSIANRADYNIESINMSLGGGKFAVACPGYAATEAIKAAREVGILTAVASGNNGYIDSIAYPACGPAAISVGATTAYPQVLAAKAVAADTVTYYSNGNKLLTMLAPGSAVNVIGSVWHGTSFAAPHVAAAIAVLAAAYPDDTPDQLQSRLVTTGKSVYDTRNKLSFPRLDLAAATQPCIYAVTPTTASVPAEGGPLSFKLTTSSSCAWTADTVDGTWLTPSATSGSGSATLTVTVAPNASVSARTGTVQFAGKTLSFSQAKDVIPPSGGLVINGGAAYTNDQNVTLSIFGADFNGVAQMCVSNLTSCTAFEAFAPTKAWKLAAVDGKKTVRLWLKDGLGNTTKLAVAATITLDTTGPTGGAVKTAILNEALNLSWSGFADALSGVASYKVVYTEGLTAPATCLLGTELYAGSELKFSHTGLTNGTTYSYRVCAIDKLGKMGAGVTGKGKPVPFTDPPTATVLINAGDATTTKQVVTLTIAGVSKAAITQMCISNAATCSAWVTFSASPTWTLSALNGTKTVSVWLRDEWGNTMTKASTDTIVWDNVAPAGGTLGALPSSQKVSISWTGVKDATTGIVAYTLVGAPGLSAPASCADGAVLFSGIGASFVHSGLPDATTYGYRLCTTDKAGNTSLGLVKVATTPVAPAPAPAP
jgi:hypothetical protein